MNNNRAIKHHPAKDIGNAPSTPGLFPQQETIENVFNESTPSHLNSSFADISSTSTPADYHVTQQSSSSLLWPDSEDLLQSILTLDPMTWDQSTAGASQSASFYDDVYLPQLPQSTLYDGNNYNLERSSNIQNNYQDAVDKQYSPAAANGDQAVQTVNGLVTRTVSISPRHMNFLLLTSAFFPSFTMLQHR
jgi:hypothetical protein